MNIKWGTFDIKFQNDDLVKTLTKRCCDLEANVLLLQKERELTEKRAVAFKKQVKYHDAWFCFGGCKPICLGSRSVVAKVMET